MSLTETTEQRIERLAGDLARAELRIAELERQLRRSNRPTVDIEKYIDIKVEDRDE